MTIMNIPGLPACGSIVTEVQLPLDNFLLGYHKLTRYWKPTPLLSKWFSSDKTLVACPPTPQRKGVNLTKLISIRLPKDRSVPHRGWGVNSQVGECLVGLCHQG